MKKPLLAASLSMLTALLISGCATLFSSTTQVVKFESYPSGAELYIDGNLVGKTPIEVEIKKETFHNYTYQFRLEGYVTFQQRLIKELNKTALFNTVMWPSWATDALTGAMIEFSPANYYVELKPRSSALRDQPDALKRLYTASNFLNIKEDIAHGSGQNTAAIAKMYHLSDDQTETFEKLMKDQGQYLISLESTTELVAAIEALTIKAKAKAKEQASKQDSTQTINAQTINI